MSLVELAATQANIVNGTATMAKQDVEKITQN